MKCEIFESVYKCSFVFVCIIVSNVYELRVLMMLVYRIEKSFFENKIFSLFLRGMQI